MTFVKSALASLTLLLVVCTAFAADQAKISTTPAPTLRAEVGKPLQVSKDLLQQKKYKEALAKVNEAAGVANLTPYERYIIDRMRGVAAGGAGDTATALKSFESALASGLMPKAEQLPTLEVMVGLAYSGKNYQKATDILRKYREEGGNNATTLALLPQTLYLAGRYAEAGKELSDQIATIESTGKIPTEGQLQLLASCAIKQNNGAAYIDALTQLVSYYPKNSYWRDLIARTATKAGFSSRLSLDVYRLRRETNTLSSAADFVDAVELALQAGLPGEAQQFLDQGYKDGLLGKGVASDVDRHNRLKALVAKKIAEDKSSLIASEKQAAAQEGGDALINSGLNYAGYRLFDKALMLIQQGIAKGRLRNADEAELHFGYVQLLAGKNDQAVKTFISVKGKDGSADLAKLWQIRAKGV